MYKQCYLQNDAKLVAGLNFNKCGQQTYTL